MYSDKQAVFPFAICKTQKLKFLLCVDFGNMTLVPVYLEFQLAFQVSNTAFQQSSGCPFTLAEQYDIIGLPDDRYSSSFVLMVEFVQINVR